MSKKCDVCNRNINIFNGNTIKDGIICPYCTTICPSYKTESIDTMRRYWQINHERFTAFTETSKLKNLMSEIISIDDNNKLFMIGKLKDKNVEPIVYSFKEVVSYNTEMIGEKTITKKKGGISRAVVGRCCSRSSWGYRRFRNS